MMNGKAGHGVTATKSRCAIECQWQACTRPGPHLAAMPKFRHWICFFRGYSFTHTHTHKNKERTLSLSHNHMQLIRNKRNKTSPNLKSLSINCMFVSFSFNFFFFQFIFIFGKWVAAHFAQNVIWKLSKWENGSEIPGNDSHSSHRQEMDSHFGEIQFGCRTLWKKLNHADIWGDLMVLTCAQWNSTACTAQAVDYWVRCKISHFSRVHLTRRNGWTLAGILKVAHFFE